VISVKDGQTTQEEIAPAYIIVGVVLVIIVIIMLCIGANWLSRRRNRKLFNTALKSFDEPNPVNYAEKMSSWTETQLSAYTAARTFLKENPPQCNKRDITPEERELIDEQGVAAWRFIVPQPSEASCRVRAEDTMPLSAYVHQGTDISFNWQSPPMNTEEEGGDDSSTELTTPLLLQTNMPIPQHRSICYFEVKLAEKPTSTEIGIGVTTRPYPDWRMPGKLLLLP
jgi:FtsZ-interacting cell division protein ZipA